MTTLGNLKSRVASDLARSDLTTDIANAISDAIDEYGDVPFYWLMEEATVSTVAGTATVALPTSFRRLHMLTVTDSAGDREDLPPGRNQISYEEYRARVWNTSSSRGQPCEYAIWNELVWFDPTPDAVYTITFSYFGPVVGVPATDGDTNAWTTTAEQMVRAKAKALIFRDVIRNVAQWQVQEKAAGDWKRKHLSRTAAQSLTYRTQPSTF